MEERWQVGMKDIRESCASLFCKELFADVFFLVGKDRKKQRIPAHKFILSCMSPVFEKLFHGSLASQSNEIEVTDIDPDGFLVFLRYIYSGKNDVNADTAMSTLYAAKKYDVPILEGLCEQYLITSVQSENAFMLLGQALHFEKAELQSRCWDVIDKDSHAALASDGFLDATVDFLCLVLERDSLCIPENDLYQAVLRWAEAHCKKQNLEPTPTNQRSVLGKAFDLIRFPLMTSEQFTLGPVTSGLLTAEEAVEIFKYMIAGKGKVEQYVNRPRNGFIFIRRFQKPLLRRTAPQGDSFFFHVNRNVCLVALDFYGCEKSPCTQHNVSVSIERADAYYGKTHRPRFVVVCDAVSRTFRVNFEQPIHLEKFDGNYNYSLTAQVTGSSVCRVGTGVQQPKTKFGDLTFTFVEEDSYYEEASRTEGQIARIILSESLSAKELRNAPSINREKKYVKGKRIPPHGFF